MARLIWTERAISDLNEIAGYIASENPDAARRLAKRIEAHLEQLTVHPLSGPVPPEDRSGLYRQISESPCRIIYRYDGEDAIILRLLRAEKLLRPSFFKGLE